MASSLWTCHIFIVIVSAFIFCIVSAVSISVDIDPKKDYLAPGDRVVLKCSSDKPGAKLTWEWLDATNNMSKDALSVTGVAAADEGSIRIDSVSGKIGGKYTCSDGTDSISQWLNVIDVDSLVPLNVSDVNGTTDVVILRCDQRIEPKLRLPLIWTKFTKELGDVILNDDDTTKVLPHFGYALRIRNKDKKRYPLKSGQYRCRLDTTNNTDANNAVSQTRSGVSIAPLVLEKTVVYESAPDVRIEGVSASGTKSATKDEPSTLTCVFNSFFPSTYASWSYVNVSAGANGSQLLVGQHYDNLTDCAIDGPNVGKKCVDEYVFSRSEGIENASLQTGQYERTLILHFPMVLDKDSGNYICQVHEYDAVKREWIENKAAVQLKVKDKLAALWPFLGIVAEVVILCAIIFIYEKRRNKTVEDEDESEPMKGNAHETTDSVVRSRKA